jgi:cysteine-rich repeat protein
MRIRLSLSLSTLVMFTVLAAVVPESGAPALAALSPLSCGDADRDGAVTSTDALLALQAGIGVVYCDDCLCDASGGSGVTATDALMLLQSSVGGQALLECTACEASVCGDSTRTPFRGALLGTTVDVTDWCLLLGADPNNIERDITVTITKALDTWLTPVDGVTASIRDRGCDCFDYLREEPRAERRETTTPAPGSVTTTTLQFCNCMAGVAVESPVPLALVETYIRLADGDCGDFVGEGTISVDGGVEEECDDGNLVAGDGCSPECRLEPRAPTGQGDK